MQLVSQLIIIGTIIYIIYEFFLEEEEDESVKRRLTEFAPKKLEDEEDSVKFIKEALNKLAQNISNKSKNVTSQKQLLVEAGMASDEESYINYITKKLTYAVVFGIAGLAFVLISQLAPQLKIMTLFIFPVLGFRMPDIKIKKAGKYRSEEITYSLPDAIDLLNVCVEAGLGLDSAINRVAVEMEASSPILSQEFKRVGKDVLAGIPRADAFRAIVKRNPSPELKSFMGLLIQTDKLGTSISQSLKVYSDALRAKRRQKAEELAAKASIKMTIPLVLFILPATFIVILTPAALSIVKVFAGGGL